MPYFLLVFVLLVATIAGGGYYYMNNNHPNGAVSLTTMTGETIIGQIKELQKMEVLTVPVTAVYTTNYDRGNALWIFENRVTQKYLVTTKIYYIQDFATIKLDIDEAKKTVKITTPELETRYETESSELMNNTNHNLFGGSSLNTNVEEQNAIANDQKTQIKADMAMKIPEYMDKGLAARDTAVTNIVSKFGYTLTK